VQFVTRTLKCDVTKFVSYAYITYVRPTCYSSLYTTMAEASILFLVRVCDCRFLHLYRAEASPGAERFACRVDFSRFCFLPIHNFTRLPATVCFYPNLYSPVGVGSECPICHVCELPMRHFVFRSLPKFQAANVAVANVN